MNYLRALKTTKQVDSVKPMTRPRALPPPIRIPPRRPSPAQTVASDHMRGRRRLAFQARGKKNFERLMRLSKQPHVDSPSISLYSRDMSSALDGGPSALVREMERTSLVPDPRASAVSFDSAFKQALRSNAHVLKYLDKIEPPEHVPFVAEVLKTLSYPARTELRSALSSINTLSEEEMRARDFILESVEGNGKLTIEPQMFSSLYGFASDPIGYHAAKDGAAAVLSEVKSTVDDFGDKIERSLSDIKISHAVNFGILDNIGPIFESLVTILKAAYREGLAFLSGDGFVSSMISTIVSVFHLPACVSEGITKLCAWVAGPRSNEDLVPQAGKYGKAFSEYVTDEVSSSYEAVITTLFYWMPSCFGEPFADIFGAEYLTEGVKHVTNLFADYKFVYGTLHSALFAVKSVMSYLAKVMGYPEIARRLTTDTLVYDATIFIDGLRERLSDNVSIPTLEDADAVRDFEKKIVSAISLCAKGDPLIEAYRLLRVKLRALMAITEKLYTNTPSHVAPSVVCLLGKPGIGKSYVLEFINQAAVIETLSIEQLNKFEELPPNSGVGIFYLNGVSKYFDGLSPHDHVMVLEEFLATKDSGTDPPASLASFTAVVNEMPTHPVMADVKEKGHMPFNMHYVTMTTNVVKWGPDELKSMVSPEAIRRRVHFPMQVVLDDRYCYEDGKYNPNHGQEVEGSAFPQRLRRWDLKRGEFADDQFHTVEEVIEMLKEHRRNAEELFAAKQNQMAETRRALIAARRENLGAAPLVPQMEGDSDVIDMRAKFEEERHSFGKMWASRARERFDRAVKGKLDLKTSDVLAVLKTYAPYAMVALAAVSLLSLAYCMTDPGPLRTESVESGPKQVKRMRASRLRRRIAAQKLKDLKAGEIAPQGLATDADTNVINMVMANVAQVFIGELVDKSVSSTKSHGSALYIGGNVLVVPAHYEDYLSAKYREWLVQKGEGDPKDLYVEFRTPGRSGGNPVIALSLLLSCFVADDDDEVDKIYIVLPPGSTKPRRNITRHVHFRSSGGESYLVTKVYGENKIHPTKAMVATANYKTVTGMKYTLPTALRYNVNTQVGDCGSILFARDSEGILGIAGFHVAGYLEASGGYSVTFGDDLDYQMFKDVGETFPVRVPKVLDVGPPLEQACPTNYEVVASIQPRPRTVVDIVQDSPCYAEASGKRPVDLSSRVIDGSWVDPLEISRGKYSKNTKVINPDSLTIAVEKVSRVIQEASTERPVYSPLSFYDCLNGVGGLSMLKRRAYPGLYEKVAYKTNDKTVFMGEEGPVDRSAPAYAALESEVESMITKIVAGEAPTQIFDSFPKAEVLDEAKVDAGKVRVIAASPMILGILTRRVYGQVHMMLTSPENILTNGSAMGTNPFGPDWTRLAQHMKSGFPVGKNAGVLCYDFKGYDGSCSSQLMEAAFDVLDLLVPCDDDESKAIRKWIRESTCYSVHRFGSSLIQMTGSNPSGNYLTTIINDAIQKIAIFLSMSNFMLVSRRDLLGLSPARPPSAFLDSTEVWEEQFEITDRKIASRVMDFYRIVTYGDDGIMSVSNAFKITTENLARSAARYGFHLTNGDKTSPYTIPQKPAPLEEASFLKRGFRWEAGVCRAPLEIESIYQALGFKNRKSTEEDRSQVYPNALMEFALHGREVYEREAPRLAREYSRMDRAFVSMSYNEALSNASSSEATVY